MDPLEDYKRVRFEEYASAVGFGLATVMFSYWGWEGLRDDQNTFSTLLSCYLAIYCGSLASSSFEQGRVMSKTVSRLEKELENQ